MIRRPPRSTLDRSSAASDVYKRQVIPGELVSIDSKELVWNAEKIGKITVKKADVLSLSLIHISEPTRPY